MTKNNFGKEFYLGNLFYNARRHRKDIDFNKLMGRIKKASNIVYEINTNFDNFSPEEKEEAQKKLKKMNLYNARSNIHRDYIKNRVTIIDMVINPKTKVYEPVSN